jgi:replicative DNA helicase
VTLADDTIKARLAALVDGGAASLGEVGVPTSALASPIRSLADAAENLVKTLKMDTGISLGLSRIDVLTRGFLPTDLVVVTGFTHSGKTQLILTMILNNPDKHILFVSLDDPIEMILAKLIAMETGEPAEELERRIRAGDERAVQLVRDAARERFSNLLVVDDVIGLNAIQNAVAEAESRWGAPCDALILDYVELIPGGVSEDEHSSVKRKMNDLKGMAKHAKYPIVALHQGTRLNAQPGQPITITSLGYSGEQQATIIIGARRKKMDAKLDQAERPFHEKTITVHVVKNKRPGGKLTHYFGEDFHMTPETGRIRPLKDADYRTENSAAAAAEAVRNNA